MLPKHQMALITSDCLRRRRGSWSSPPSSRCCSSPRPRIRARATARQEVDPTHPPELLPSRLLPSLPSLFFTRPSRAWRECPLNTAPPSARARTQAFSLTVHRAVSASVSLMIGVSSQASRASRSASASSSRYSPVRPRLFSSLPSLLASSLLLFSTVNSSGSFYSPLSSLRSPLSSLLSLRSPLSPPSSLSSRFSPLFSLRALSLLCLLSASCMSRR